MGRTKKYLLDAFRGQSHFLRSIPRSASNPLHPPPILSSNSPLYPTLLTQLVCSRHWHHDSAPTRIIAPLPHGHSPSQDGILLDKMRQPQLQKMKVR
ncbi:hypothetical protein XELAEV_18033537mg [Xenopus laevis]|uniref:Uncharacterized protein n=1 Tax=Xenopus laevis TaxID=8355 RepID=A0A974HE22_XENLA|nr:hypothetical protein XELAEV_18033537mg [Xenopus laevis]